MYKIGLEEHFLSPALTEIGAQSDSIAQPAVWAEASRKLLDLFDERISDMDACGLDRQVLSLVAPGIEGDTDPKLAVERAITVNDFLADAIRERPDRFGGFAALPLQDPARAAAELERAVVDLGFHGALINAHSNGRYLDDPAFRVVWAQAEALDVPLYIHPAHGVDVPHTFTGHPQLVGPLWSWGMDTATHALRLIFGGVFDDFPRAKLLLGHLGETLPYVLWRLDSRWGYHKHHGISLKRELPSEYIRSNFYVTMSGVYSDEPLRCAIDALGIEHVLFATDYPFEELTVACDFMEEAKLSPQERELIAHGNAQRLLRVPEQGN